MFGGRKEFFRLNEFDDLDQVHNSDSGADKFHNGKVVRDEEIGQAEFTLKIFEEIDDLGSMRLARDVAKKAEETLQYPGQIKVTVIRETRAVDYAK